MSDWSDAVRGNTEKRLQPSPEDYWRVVGFLGNSAGLVVDYLFATSPDGMSAGEVGALLILIEQEELARTEVAQIVALAARELAAQNEAGGKPGEE